MNEIPKILEKDENSLWYGKPKILAFFARQILGIVVTFIIILGFLVIMPTLSSYLFHIVVIFILLLVYCFLQYRIANYSITNKRVIFQSGIIGRDFKIIDFDKIQNMHVTVGIVDKIFNTGTINIFSGKKIQTKYGMQLVYDKMEYIENPYEVFKKIKKTSFDIKTDIEFPNKYRPKQAGDYGTEHKP